MSETFSHLKQGVIVAIGRVDRVSERQRDPLCHVDKKQGLADEKMNSLTRLGGALLEFLNAGNSIIFIEPHVQEETSRKGYEHQRVEACEHFELVDPYERPDTAR